MSCNELNTSPIFKTLTLFCYLKYRLILEGMLPFLVTMTKFTKVIVNSK